jgi:hypothetical protein
MTQENKLLRENILAFIQAAIEDKVITTQDLKQFIPKNANPTEPEYLRQDMETWYKILGIENLVGRSFSLRLPYFTEGEIKEAYENNEILLCVPKGVTKKQLGTLFNFSSWAIEDSLVNKTVEIEDFWFKTKNTIVPDYLDKTGIEINREFQKERKLGMSLERYMVLVARMRYLYGKTPDVKYRTWITRGKYEGNSMLIAGFDSQMKFSVHGWLPHFHSPLCGGRYIVIPDHLYL